MAWLFAAAGHMAGRHVICLPAICLPAICPAGIWLPDVWLSDIWLPGIWLPDIFKKKTYGEKMSVVEINFLCVHKKLRSKVPPSLFKTALVGLVNATRPSAGSAGIIRSCLGNH